jgi:zinc transport system ATP-binding protein
MKPLIQVENLSVAYEEQVVLREVNLTLYEHDFLGIIGPNGGGKTTLIKALLGLLPIRKGSIRLFADGAPTDHLTMGYLPQSNNIDRTFPISVEEVVQSGLCGKRGLFRPFSAQQREKVRQVILRMGLEGLERRAIGKLSGGQLQRALLGRAVVSDPAVLILDEPSTYIDQQFESRLYELLAEINRDCAVILVSHDIGTVLQQVKSIACVNETVDYHPDTRITSEWLEKNFHCPIDLLGHGTLPHRILGEHKHSHK